jgi:hypothetical protein
MDGMSLIGSERKRGFLGKLGRSASEVLATIRYGHPFAADPEWRKAQAEAEAARTGLQCRRLRQAENAKRARVHAFLEAGRGR